MSVDHGELTTFRDQPLLVIPSAELDRIEAGTLISKEPYLGSDVYQGRYGVASFAMVVPSPPERQVVYSADEGPAGAFYGDGKDDIEDPVRRAHYYETDRGFAVLRVVLAPEKIQDKLEQDKFLGSAVIDKCCLDETVARELDEDTKLAGHYMWNWLATKGWSWDKELTPLEQKVYDGLQQATGLEYSSLREYPSWHSYRMYEAVLAEIRRGCQATVVNFDQILALLAKDIEPVHDFDARKLSGQLAVNPPEST